MITPAISVLSAVEGLEVATPGLEAYVTPTAVVVLIGLFVVQSRGSARIRAFFGPIMVIWFLALAIAGFSRALSRHLRACCTESDLCFADFPGDP